MKVKEDEARDGLSNKDGLEDVIFQCPVKCGFSSIDEDEMFKHVRRHDLEALELRRTQDQAKAMDDAKARADEQAEKEKNKAIADLKLWKGRIY